MAIIRKTLTYNLPDDYLAQTNDLGKTAEWEFIGPECIWVLIDKETNKYTGRYFTHDHNGDEMPTPLDCYKLHVDCETDPLLCALVHAETEKPDYADLDQHEELLPDGLHYRRALHPPPDHTHNISQMTFDPATMSYVKPYPWILPHSTWEGMRAWRNAQLAATDEKAGDDLDDMPATLKANWSAFRQHLRDIPQTHGANNTHIYLDLTGQAPINRAGSTIIKVTSVAGIVVGDDVGVRGWPVEDIFGEHSQVVSINTVAKEITLDKALILTPTEGENHKVAFSPCPATDPWKVGAHTAPDGTGGVDGTNGHPGFDPKDPTKILVNPLAHTYNHPV